MYGRSSQNTYCTQFREQGRSVLELKQRYLAHQLRDHPSGSSTSGSLPGVAEKLTRDAFQSGDLKSTVNLLLWDSTSGAGSWVTNRARSIGIQLTSVVIGYASPSTASSGASSR